jgi:hypothetical protein
MYSASAIRNKERAVTRRASPELSFFIISGRYYA